MKKEKMKNVLKTAWEFIVNPRLLLCFGFAWMITNGWSYIMLALGAHFEIKWMATLAGGYIAFLWLPVSAEKIITVAITIALLRFWFPRDTRTLGKLKALRGRLKIKKRSPKKEQNSKDGT